MAGSARTVLVPNGLKWPNALAIDHGSETLYWTDANMKLIEMLHLESVGSRPQNDFPARRLKIRDSKILSSVGKPRSDTFQSQFPTVVVVTPSHAGTTRCTLKHGLRRVT